MQSWWLSPPWQAALHPRAPFLALVSTLPSPSISWTSKSLRSRTALGRPLRASLESLSLPKARVLLAHCVVQKESYCCSLEWIVFFFSNHCLALENLNPSCSLFQLSTTKQVTEPATSAKASCPGTGCCSNHLPCLQQEPLVPHGFFVFICDPSKCLSHWF